MKSPETAKRLRMAMKLRDIKAQELADKTGIHKSSISQYVNGSHAPSNISAGKMGEVLDVNPVWLMGLDAPMLKPLKHDGEMGQAAEAESLYLQELGLYTMYMNDDDKRRILAYVKGIYELRKADEELK